MLAAVVAILLYIWFRFEWQFGIGAVIALTQCPHDHWPFALLQLEFNVSTVAAVLTIAGYSINDTVVVHDRVRENMRRYKRLSMIDLFNRSINETLSRTVMTLCDDVVSAVCPVLLWRRGHSRFYHCPYLGRIRGNLFFYCSGSTVVDLFKIDRSLSNEMKTKRPQRGHRRFDITPLVPKTVSSFRAMAPVVLRSHGSVSRVDHRLRPTCPGISPNTMTSISNLMAVLEEALHRDLANRLWAMMQPYRAS